MKHKTVKIEGYLAMPRNTRHYFTWYDVLSPEGKEIFPSFYCSADEASEMLQKFINRIASSTN